MSAIDQIMKQLDTVFAPMDAKILENTQEWAKGRVVAVREFWKSDEAKSLYTWRLYDRLFAIAGGKGWYNIFQGNSFEIVAEKVEKNCRMVALKRNANISKKLAKAGVSRVTESTINYCKDGFDGIFLVETDQGPKRVTVSTIYAGGYNVQCLHLRVLTKVKDIKEEK